jgi:hypothetical protein
MRYFKDEPLQHYHRNNYTKAEKLQIVVDLWNDYENGLLNKETISWIVENKRCGHFSCKLIIEDMIKKGIVDGDFTGCYSPQDLQKPKKEYDL